MKQWFEVNAHGPLRTAAPSRSQPRPFVRALGWWHGSARPAAAIRGRPRPLHHVGVGIALATVMGPLRVKQTEASLGPHISKEAQGEPCERSMKLISIILFG